MGVAPRKSVTVVAAPHLASSVYGRLRTVMFTVTFWPSQLGQSSGRSATSWPASSTSRTTSSGTSAPKMSTTPMPPRSSTRTFFPRGEEEEEEECETTSGPPEFAGFEETSVLCECPIRDSKEEEDDVSSSFRSSEASSEVSRAPENRGDVSAASSLSPTTLPAASLRVSSSASASAASTSACTTRSSTPDQFRNAAETTSRTSRAADPRTEPRTSFWSGFSPTRSVSASASASGAAPARPTSVTPAMRFSSATAFSSAVAARAYGLSRSVARTSATEASTAKIVDHVFAAASRLSKIAPCSVANVSAPGNGLSVTFRCMVTFPCSPHAVAASYTFAPYWMFSVNEKPKPTTNARYAATRGFFTGTLQPAAGDKHPTRRRDFTSSSGTVEPFSVV
mmetsp:Transcript_2681/g.10640  ORF Transcript_2681/g.10640 Transcript_2681/m.10640 type:complete len:395 (-) Transcript_2681:787-1971(-)